MTSEGVSPVLEAPKWPIIPIELSCGQDISILRRVAAQADVSPKVNSVANPTLDGLAYAARNAGIKKMKREEGVSHPARPSEKEGRLWISIKDAQSATGTDSKEGVLQAIGSAWNTQQSEAKAAEGGQSQWTKDG